MIKIMLIIVPLLFAMAHAGKPKVFTSKYKDGTIEKRYSTAGFESGSGYGWRVLELTNGILCIRAPSGYDGGNNMECFVSADLGG